MTEETKYIIEDTRWLLSFGRPAIEVARQLHRSPDALYRMSLRHNLPDIRDAFMPLVKGR